MGVINATSSGLMVNGSGTLVLDNANTYTGLTVINSGATVVAANSNALGTCASGTVVSPGATLAIQNLGTAVSGTEPLSVGGTIEMLTGGTNVDVMDGAVTLWNQDATINVPIGELVLNGAIGGAYGIDKTGLGMLIQNAGNTYAGLTTVSQGVLQATAATSLGSLLAGTIVADGAYAGHWRHGVGRVADHQRPGRRRRPAPATCSSRKSPLTPRAQRTGPAISSSRSRTT